MESNYSSPNPNYASGPADYSTFANVADFAQDVGPQLPQSHSMMYTNSNGSNGWDTAPTSQDPFSLTSQLMDSSSPQNFDATRYLSPVTNYTSTESTSLNGLAASDNIFIPSPQHTQTQAHLQDQYTSYGTDLSRQQSIQDTVQRAPYSVSNNHLQHDQNQHHHHQEQMQSSSHSQEAMMTQMMNYANSYEFTNSVQPITSAASMSGPIFDSTSPFQSQQPQQHSLEGQQQQQQQLPGRLQRTSSLSAATNDYRNPMALRPSPQGRSKSHSLAAGFGMMGPPPRPIARMPHSSKVMSPFGRVGGNNGSLATTSPHAMAPSSPPESGFPTYSASNNSSLSLASSANSVAKQVQQSPTPAHSQQASPKQTSRSAGFPSPSLSTFSMNPTRPSSPFDAASRGLPVLPSRPTTASASAPWEGMYSQNGFDMVGVLARVAARPNPQLSIGPVDLNCSFVVVDAKKFDQPIVYVSDTFTRLTGYSAEEILGRNCRFLQSPDGQVTQGEKRKYTDGNAAHHIRRHIMQGKESQASMINYCKGGRPFINLITVVPITWDSDEIAYYVGFQVDLVEQPAAITEKMKNGSYAIDYRVVNSNLPRELSAPSMEAISVEHLDEMSGSSSTAQASHTITPDLPMAEIVSPETILEQVDGNGPSGLATEAGKKLFNRMLLENCDDFVHVLSLKGSLLYVSPSSKRLLEYEPQGLVGKSLSSFCHPSDIVSVLRELKESGTSQNSAVDLVFRFRRKNSGYTWIEAHGKLHLEQGKGRKCVILVGRVRHVYKMSWNDLERAGGFGKQEFWSKLTTTGMHLYSTPNVTDLLGFHADDLIGKTYAEMSPDADRSGVMDALQQASKGQPSTARHHLTTKNGSMIEVVTHFYPSRSQTDEEPASPRSSRSSNAEPFTIIAQTNSAESERAKDVHPVLPSAPSTASRALAAQRNQSNSSNDSSRSNSSRPSLASTPASNPSSSASSSSSLLTLPSFNMSARGSNDSNSTSGTSVGNSTTSFSAITSTYKTLEMNSNVSDNIFDELDSVRGTSWQFELHQMRLTNKKLREEKEALVALQNKKRRREAGNRSDPGKFAIPEGVRACLNCGKTQSAEWRTGPTGPKTLCNACGLRWSKSVSFSKTKKQTPGPGDTPTPASSPTVVKAQSVDLGFSSPPATIALEKLQRPSLPHTNYSMG